MQSIEQRDVAVGFERVDDEHSVAGLLGSKPGAGAAETFRSNHLLAAGLAFLHAGVAALLPYVMRNALRRVRGFLPSVPPLGGELRDRDRAQAVRLR